MKTRLILLALGLIAAVGLATPAFGFDILEAKTEAEIAPPSPITPVIQLASERPGLRAVSR